MRYNRPVERERGQTVHRNRLYILGKSTRSKPGIRESQGAYIAGARPKVLSLFSGAMGLDLGLEAAGFEIAGCLECNKHACETIRLNRCDLPLIEDDIRNWTAKQILSKIDVRGTDIDLIVGGPPCPSFSTAGRRKSFDDPRGQVMFDFLRIVDDIHPQFFVMENVRGILSASLSHVPLVDRGRNGHVRKPEEMPGGVMVVLNERFKKMGYTVTAQLVNAANYGVPQKRERVVFVGSRAGLTITLPSGEYSQKGGLFHRPWRTLEDAFEGLVDKNPEFLPISPNRKKYFNILKSGQNWRDLPTHMIKEALGG
ncbi:MAG: DNA cytosine methyltransferase, partial [Candidatus Hydrogenedentota bacterium]